MDDRDHLSETTFLPAPASAMLIINRPLPLRWKTLHRYAAARGLDGDDFELFLRVLRALDGEYLKIRAELRSGVSGGNESDDG